MAQLTPSPKQQFFDDDGELLAGGLVYTYLTNTSTPAATYSDAAGATANANPIVLDSAGRASIFLDTAVVYRFVLKRSDLTTVYTQNGIAAAASGGDSGDGDSETADSLTVLFYPDAEFERGAVTISYQVPSFPPPGSKDGDLIFVVAEPDTSTLRFTGSPAAGVLGSAYNVDLAPAGGAGPYTVALVGGALPDGVAIDGTELDTTELEAAATFNFTLRATDSLGATVDRPFAITVTDPANPAPSPVETDFSASGLFLDGYVGVPYMSDSWYGGEGLAAVPRSLRMTELELSGTTVPGLTIRSHRTTSIAGFPTTAATYGFDADVSEIGGFGLKSAEVTVAQSVVISAAPTKAVIDAFSRGGISCTSFVTDAVAPFQRFRVRQQTNDTTVTGLGTAVTLPGADTEDFYAEITLHDIRSGDGENFECGIAATPEIARTDWEFWGIAGVKPASSRVGTEAIWRYIAHDGNGNGLIDSGSTSATTVARLVTGDVVMVYGQPSTGKCWFGVNGTWIGNPTAGTGASLTNLVLPVDAYADHFRIYAQGGYDATYNDDISINCGATAFTYTPPNANTGMAYVAQTYPSWWSATNRTEFVYLTNGPWQVRGGTPGGLDEWDALAQVGAYYLSPNYGSALGAKSYSSGKRQFEMKLLSGSQRSTWMGFALSSSDATALTFLVGAANDSVGVRLWGDSPSTTGQRSADGVTSTFGSANATPFATVLTFALDLDADTYSIYADGVIVVNAAALPVAASAWCPAFSGEAGANVALQTKDLQYPVATYSDWVA